MNKKKSKKNKNHYRVPIYNELKFGDNSFKVSEKTPTEKVAMLAEIMDLHNPNNDSISASFSPKSGKASANIGRNITSERISSLIWACSKPLGLTMGGFTILKYSLDFAKIYLDDYLEMHKEKRKEKHDEKMQDKKMQHEKEIARIKHPSTSITSAVNSIEETPEEPESRNLETWSESFRRNFGRLPNVPKFIHPFIEGCPKGYSEPMLFHLLSMFGALCFSKVRAKYLDKKLHAPNLGVIIEGNWGSGKGKFEDAFGYIFKEVIDVDTQKLNANDVAHHIIQAAGIGVSESKFGDVLAECQGAHVYAFQAEIIAAYHAIKKGNGLRFDHLRYAFDNSNIYVNNRNKDSKNGFYPVYLNYTFTGTPQDTATFIGKELEGGTASRICWSCIPETGIYLESLEFPKDMKEVYKQIREWRNQYCYTTNQEGVDSAVPEITINLDYVSDALKGWIEDQGHKSLEDGNAARKDMRARAAASAFHCAIVLHMLAGQPTSKEGRQEIADLVVYLANYILERFIFKFGAIQNEQRKANRDAEYVNVGNAVSDTTSSGYTVKSAEQSEAEALKALYDEGKGQKKIAKEHYGSDEDKNVKRVKYILNKYYPRQILWGENRPK